MVHVQLTFDRIPAGSAMTAPVPGSRTIRVDIDHTIQELMKSAVSRISREIRVKFRERQVQLSGSVQSWYEKQMAQESLRSVSRSYAIRNDIRVPAWN